MNRLVHRGPLLLAVLVVPSGCGPEQAPVQLTHAVAAAEGRAYVTTLEQQMAMAMGDHSVSGRRELRAAYTLRADESNGQDHRAVVHLDSVRATLILGESQVRIDTRDLPGREFAVAISTTGGPPDYGEGEIPAIETGERAGGAIPTSLLVDYGFPRLPDQPVSKGSTWTEQRTHRRIEGTVWVTADVTTTYTVRGLDTSDGTPCLAVLAESSGSLSDALAHGETINFAGELRGSATWCFDTSSGVVVRMQGEEVTDGRIESDRASATIGQTTTVNIERLADGGSP